jgi:ABC-type dipeptide/oligopeptide/nickel transport system permease component
MVPVAFLSSVILFVLLKLTPGDPVLIVLGERVTTQNYESKPALTLSSIVDRAVDLDFADVRHATAPEAFSRSRRVAVRQGR